MKLKDEYARKKAQRHLENARRLMADRRGATRPLSVEEVIAKVRATREQLWEAKLAARP